MAKRYLAVMFREYKFLPAAYTKLRKETFIKAVIGLAAFGIVSALLFNLQGALSQRNEHYYWTLGMVFLFLGILSVAGTDKRLDLTRVFTTDQALNVGIRDRLMKIDYQSLKKIQLLNGHQAIFYAGTNSAIPVMMLSNLEGFDELIASLSTYAPVVNDPKPPFTFSILFRYVFRFIYLTIGFAYLFFRNETATYILGPLMLVICVIAFAFALRVRRFSPSPMPLVMLGVFIFLILYRMYFTFMHPMQYYVHYHS